MYSYMCTNSYIHMYVYRGSYQPSKMYIEVVINHPTSFTPQAASGGLPRNWTCADPGAVHDKLEDLYPWIQETSQARIQNH